MLVTKNVLNRCNHSLLVGSLFHMETKNPFFFTKRAFDDNSNIFNKRSYRTIKVSVFCIPYGRTINNIKKLSLTWLSLRLSKACITLCSGRWAWKWTKKCMWIMWSFQLLFSATFVCSRLLGMTKNNQQRLPAVMRSCNLLRNDLFRSANAFSLGAQAKKGKLQGEYKSSGQLSS